jgi:hypothetical protein
MKLRVWDSGFDFFVSVSCLTGIISVSKAIYPVVFQSPDEIDPEKIVSYFIQQYNDLQSVVCDKKLAHKVRSQLGRINTLSNELPAIRKWFPKLSIVRTKGKHYKPHLIAAGPSIQYLQDKVHVRKRNRSSSYFNW